MNKKLIAGIVIAAAVVCCGGGYVAMQNEKKVKQENVQISEMLDKLPDITVKEGESLPDLKNNIEDTSMIEPDTLKVDIQNVDITVPGTYDVVYSFKDIHGNERSKTVQCKVEANLLDHVYGMDDIETDCGKELPKDETTFDEEYVSSVTRDDSEVDIDTPGTYNITYTVLGTDGSMEEADRLAKVLETAETTQAPEEIVETPAPTEETTPETGNVEPIEQETVKTGDNTNVTGYVDVLDEETMQSESVPIAPLVERASEMVFQEAVASLKNMTNYMRDYDILIPTGGTCSLWMDKFKEHFKGMKSLTVIPGNRNDKLPLLYANVRGYFMFCHMNSKAGG